MPAAMTPAVNGVSEHMPNKVPEKLILCFDGTGNQYSADTSDTNVVKLYQKFDRQAPDQYHYYQRELLLVSDFADTARSICQEQRTQDCPLSQSLNGC